MLFPSPSDFLSDGVLDLQSGIDFDEEVLSLVVHEEFHSACILVADMLGQSECVCQNFLANAFGQSWGWGDFHNLQT